MQFSGWLPPPFAISFNSFVGPFEMGKRASEAFAGNQSWGFLERIDAELHAAVTAIYSSVLQFDGAFDTIDGAADLVRELLPHRSARDVATMSRSLGAWKSRGRLAPSMARQLSEGLPAMPRRVLRPRVDPGEAFTSLVESSPAIALEKLKKAIKARRASKVGREEREKESRERWGLELVSYIKEAGLPCADRMLAMGDHNNLWLRLFGNRRSKTLRNRAMAWRGFRAWMQVAYGSVWPDSVAAFLKYLEERHEVKPLGKTTPGALLASLSLLESVGQVPSDDRFSHDSMLIESVRSWQTELESGAKPVKQAPMYTVAILLACELVVRKSSIAVGYRLMAFFLLVMIWGTLRADDVQNIDPSSLQLSQVGLRFVLGRTKTSGLGRRVGTLPGFVSRTTGISGLDWLGEGMRILKSEDFGWSRDFLCPRFSADWDACSRDYLDAEGLALQIRRFLSELRTPFRYEGRWGLNRELLIPGRMVHYWTGHSARHTLPSLAAALEIGKEKRDFLGRWAYSQHGSQDYVLTSRQVVHAVQNHVCKSLILGGYVEEEVLSDLEVYAKTCGLGAESLVGHHVLRWNGTQRTWALGGTFPAFQVAGQNRAEVTGDLDAETKEPFKVVENSKIEGDFPYFISVSRSGFRRLHLSGACAVKQERCAETVGLHSISEGCADAICKLCRPKVDATDSSSSGSETVEGSQLGGPAS